MIRGTASSWLDPGFVKSFLYFIQAIELFGPFLQLIYQVVDRFGLDFQSFIPRVLDTTALPDFPSILMDNGDFSSIRT